MSVFRPREVPCPYCDHTETRTVALSVNASRTPALRQEILDDRFQRVQCSACGRGFGIDGPMSYLDFERRQFFGLYPRPWLRAWKALEAELAASFHASLIEHAPQVLRDETQAGFVVRALFGLTALRDKLLCFDAGLDDVALEALKLDLLREHADTLLHDDMQLGLQAVEESQLHFAARALSSQRNGHGRMVTAELVVPRERLATVTTDAAWEPLRVALSAGVFVDVRRLFLPGEAPRP